MSRLVLARGGEGRQSVPRNAPASARRGPERPAIPIGRGAHRSSSEVLAQKWIKARKWETCRGSGTARQQGGWGEGEKGRRGDRETRRQGDKETRRQGDRE